MSLIRLHSVDPHVTTLGPPPAAGIWVQGCDIGCRDCTSRSTWESLGGAHAEVADVAGWLSATGRSNLTLSGGEPMDQAEVLAELIDAIRLGQDWVVTCYSGYRLEALQVDHRPGSAALLERIDLLIDGPYLAQQHAPLRWRGSRNQRLHSLTGRVEVPDDPIDDVAVGVEVVLVGGEGFELIGVPPVPRMAERFAEALDRNETPVEVSRRARAFPFATVPNPLADPSGATSAAASPPTPIHPHHREVP